jgi:hypothetical protein
MTGIEMLAGLIVAHVVCDYPLQGDFLAKAKNRAAPLPGVPWWQALGAHAAIHGGGVWLVTGSIWLGLAETVAHAVIDDRKCSGRLTFNQDQALHVALKVLWVAIAMVTP